MPIDVDCKHAPRCPAGDELGELLALANDVRDAGRKRDLKTLCEHISPTIERAYYEPDGLSCREGVKLNLGYDSMPQGKFFLVRFQGNDEVVEAFFFNRGGYVRFENTRLTAGQWKIFGWNRGSRP